MPKKMKLNPDFTPIPVKEDYEIFRNGIFEFNITAIIQFIRQNPEKILLENVQVSTFPAEFSRINEDHMPSVKLGEPVILAEISPGNYNLIDGNHRMEKARRQGVETVEAYRLSSEIHRGFLTSIKAYKCYAEYWNDKVSFL